MEFPVPITGLYAGIQALIAFVLVAPIGRARGRLGVSLGDGGNPELTVLVRRHANWAEHVPFALLLMALLELNGGGATLLHGLGAALTVARLAHPLGLSAEKLNSPLRIAGAAITGVVTLVAGLLSIVKFF